MKLKEGITVSELLKQIQLCRGEVEFRTSEGDCLNLKSELSKYLFAAICERRDFMEKGSLDCEDKNDRQALLGFFDQM